MLIQLNPFDLLADKATQICTFELVSTKNTSQFVKLIQRLSPAPIIVARVMGWIITPTHLSVDELMSTEWDFFLVHNTESAEADAESGKANAAIMAEISPLVTTTFKITARVPTALLDDLTSRNARVLHPSSDEAVLPLTGSLDNPSRPGFFTDDSQPLKMTKKLFKWFQDTGTKKEGQRAVTMFNLLAQDPAKVDLYRAYGKGFHDGVGVKRGGFAKLVGNVVDGRDGWDEVAVAHYPSLAHFADMVAGEDYQEINDKYRVPALRDTLILCTTEVFVGE